LFDIDENDPNIFDEDSVRVSAGFGISWRSPFGPIRIDVAKALVSESFDEDELFRFSFGTRF
jgi:outer membrane protein insertion porin family